MICFTFSLTKAGQFPSHIPAKLIDIPLRNISNLCPKMGKKKKKKQHISREENELIKMIIIKYLKITF